MQITENNITIKIRKRIYLDDKNLLHLKRSIEHWERMIQWAKTTRVIYENTYSRIWNEMYLSIEENWDGRYCALCQLHKIYCDTCPILKAGHCCDDQNSIWKGIKRDWLMQDKAYWIEHAEMMLALLYEILNTAYKWNSKTRRLIRKSCHHWERMIKWALKEPDEEFYDWEMKRAIRQNAYGTYCALCKNYSYKKSYSGERCYGCPLQVTENGCNSAGSVWVKASRGAKDDSLGNPIPLTREEWAKNAALMVDTLRKLI